MQFNSPVEQISLKLRSLLAQNPKIGMNKLFFQKVCVSSKRFSGHVGWRSDNPTKQTFCQKSEHFLLGIRKII